MKELVVRSLNMNGFSSSLEQLLLNIAFQDIAFLQIESINWPQYTHKPDVFVKLVQLNDGLFLHYKVYEPNVQALVTNDNGPVYNDSCVEFFIDPTGEGSYYNFEFNCIGSALLCYGNSRYNRTQSPDEIILQIKRFSSLGVEAIAEIVDPFWWNLLVFIPFSCFFKHQIFRLKGNLRGNFYKCGNATKIPHYVSWNPVKSKNPDFHKPECFGTLRIE